MRNAIVPLQEPHLSVNGIHQGGKYIVIRNERQEFNLGTGFLEQQNKDTTNQG